MSKFRRRAALIGLIAGVSLVTPYTLAAIARRFPKSPFATLNNDLHKQSGSSNG